MLVLGCNQLFGVDLEVFSPFLQLIVLFAPFDEWRTVKSVICSPKLVNIL